MDYVLINLSVVSDGLRCVGFSLLSLRTNRVVKLVGSGGVHSGIPQTLTLTDLRVPR